MSTELIINASLPETRIALMESGEIQDLIIERATGKGIVGNIYKGRVTRVLPGMQAAFVDIGLEKAAFLYVDDVFVHSEIFDEDEAPVQSPGQKVLAEVGGAAPISRGPIPNSKAAQQSAASGSSEGGSAESTSSEGGIQSEGGDPSSGNEMSGNVSGDSQTRDQEDYLSSSQDEEDEEGDSDSDSDSDDDLDSHSHEHGTSHSHGDDDNDNGEHDEDEEDDLDEDDLHAHLNDEDDEDDQEDDDGEPTKMAAEGEGNDGDSSSSHPGTVSPSGGESQSGGESEAGSGEGSQDGDKGARRGRHRRGRRGGKFRRKPGQDKLEAGGEGASGNQGSPTGSQGGAPGSENQGNPDENGEYPSHFNSEISDESNGGESDRSAMVGEAGGPNGEDVQGRPVTDTQGNGKRGPATDKQALKSTRNSDRRVPSRSARRPVRAQVNIQDLLKEGQEVLVQVAKDPIATKGARLTCHISLPGRHLVCMPTIDHVGVSRRIEKDEERRRLRDVVERNRPRNLGFIVRTASGRGQAEKRIKQDIDYLTRLWDEIREKAGNVTAPALVYEDLNSVLRAIRDWVTDDIDKIIVDSRYHYNDILRFVSHFMPSLKQKVELYHGDVPIFDAYNISTELSRALERKVWLKSGGYLVIDQAEALVAIDVNTGRYVGKKNLEDTILKTNLEAVQEIAYQLRLRNCGGIIILDLIDMEKEENKQRVYRALEEALRRDRARPTILKISELGLVEMTRKRTRDTIVRALCESCSFCEGKGFIKSKTTIAYEVLREIEREGIERDVSKILVQAHPDVIDILAIDERETLDQIERRYRKQVYLQSITESHPEQFEVSSDKKPGKQAGDFHEVLQPQKTHNSDKNNERGGERDRGRNGGRDKNRGRDQNKDQNRDANRDANREANGEPIRESIGREPRGGRDRNRDQSGEQNSDQPRGKGVVIPPRPSKIPQPRAIPLAVELGQSGEPGNMAGGEAPQQQAPVQVDDENYGNRISSGPVRNHQNNTNYSNNQDNAGNRVQGSAPASDPDDFYDEEDRLAFLRAQATQDAALAKFRGAEASPSVGNHRGGGQNRGGQGQGEGGGRNNNRNRRGGRGGRNNQQGGQKFGGRDNQGGGGQGGGRNQGGGQNRGPRPFNQRPNQGGANAAGGQGPQPGNSTADAGGGNTTSTKSEGRGDGGGNQDGGGGDHSQPPA